MAILVIAEHNQGKVQEATYSTLAAAQQLEQEVHLLIAAADVSQLAETLSKAEGVTKVLTHQGAEFDHATAEAITELVMSVADGYEYILASATTFGKNFLPRVAALLDVQQISDISAVVSGDTFKRPIYAGNAIATVKTTDSKKVLSVRGTAFDGVAKEGGQASIESVDFGLGEQKSEFVSQELTKSERPELTSAKVIVSGGRGMQNGENFAMIEALADKLGAGVGASRAAVDAGFVPNDYQVGQTGKIVAPELYIAIGISGAIQHLAGMKDSKVIVAINKDEEAPIFQVADYGLVADLFSVLPELTEALD